MAIESARNANFPQYFADPDDDAAQISSNIEDITCDKLKKLAIELGFLKTNSDLEFLNNFDNILEKIIEHYNKFQEVIQQINYSVLKLHEGILDEKDPQAEKGCLIPQEYVVNRTFSAGDGIIIREIGVRIDHKYKWEEVASSIMFSITIESLGSERASFAGPSYGLRAIDGGSRSGEGKALDAILFSPTPDNQNPLYIRLEDKEVGPGFFVIKVGNKDHWELRNATQYEGFGFATLPRFLFIILDVHS